MKGGISRMRYTFQQIEAKRRAEGKEPGLIESGFTLIELLIVIVVLGILAAVVIFALSGVTASSAVSACNADAKSVEVAIQAYNTQHGSFPASSADLTTNSPTQYLRQWPSNGTHYAIAMDGSGNVFVNPNSSATAVLAANNYDTAATNPCSTVK
jgi:general secretion pathway protein G